MRYVLRFYRELTPRQHEVVYLVAEGCTDKQIAVALGISEDTVAFHIQRIATRWDLDRTRNIRVQIATRHAA